MPKLYNCLISWLLLIFVAAGAAAADHVSSLLMDAETGQILVAEDPERQWVPASVVKLMLLLLAEEAIAEGRVAPGDTITATSRAQRQGGSQVYLAKGEKVRFQKLLEATAVGSANDAAVAIAVALYGSADQCVAAMNERAAALGMTGTRYVNVTGLPEGRRENENLSTAMDQALLAREIVLRHPLVLEWTKLTWTRFRRGLVIACTNTLLKEMEGVDGLKTGFHNSARSNLVATAKRGDRRLIAVVLGASTQNGRNETARRLMESGFANYVTVTALAQGDAFGEDFPVAKSWRGTVPVEAGATLSFLVKPGEREGVHLELALSAPLEAPLEAGQTLGEIRAVQDGRLLASVPARAGHAVKRAWFSFGRAGETPPLTLPLPGG